MPVFVCKVISERFSRRFFYVSSEDSEFVRKKQKRHGYTAASGAPLGGIEGAAASPVFNGPNPSGRGTPPGGFNRMDAGPLLLRN